MDNTDIPFLAYPTIWVWANSPPMFLNYVMTL